VNPENLIAGEGETYPDHCEKSANGAKSSFGWCDARDLLREIQDLDGHIQRGEDVVLTFLLLRIVIHRFEVDVVRGHAAVGRRRGGARASIEMGGHFITTCLVRPTVSAVVGLGRVRPPFVHFRDTHSPLVSSAHPLSPIVDPPPTFLAFLHAYPWFSLTYFQTRINVEARSVSDPVYIVSTVTFLGCSFSSPKSEHVYPFRYLCKIGVFINASRRSPSVFQVDRVICKLTSC